MSASFLSHGTATFTLVAIVMPSEYDVWLRLAEHMIETFAPRPLLQIP
jgi:hypothetical protein